MHAHSLSDYCSAGSTSAAQFSCPAGRFGGVKGLGDANCSGAASAGYYTPPGSTSTTAVICPPGSYGDTLGLGTPDCSGPCSRGYYCPAGSTRPTQVQCPAGTVGNALGAATAACAGPCPLGSFCGVGTIIPTPCPPGTYGGAPGLTSSACSGSCAVGYFCGAGSTSAQAAPCPGGAYGATQGLSSPSCSGTCATGYYCPPASTTAISLPCPEGYLGAPGCANATCGGACPPGTFCGLASIAVQLCPAGRFNPSPAAASLGACRACNLGQAASAGAPACNVCGMWTLSNFTACSACPRNQYCTGSGYYACIADGRCTGSGCAEGYKDKLCQSCVRGYYLQGSTCQACPSYIRTGWILAGVVAFLLLVLAYFVQRARCARFSYARFSKLVLPLFKNRLVYLSLYSNLNDILLLNNITSIPLPFVFRGWYMWMLGLVFSANINLSIPECVISEWDLLKTFFVTFGFSVIVILLSCQAISLRFATATTIPFFLRQVLQQSMRVFSYTTSPVDGAKYLSYDASLSWLYNNPMHAAAFALGLIASLFYGWFWLMDMRTTGFGVWPAGNSVLTACRGDALEKKPASSATAAATTDPAAARAARAKELFSAPGFPRWLLQSNSINGERSNDHFTPLMVAVIRGCKTDVELLLARAATTEKPNLVNAQSSTGMTPLMFACITGDHDIVKELLKPECKPDVLLKTDDIGMTCVMWAALMGHKDIVVTILESVHFCSGENLQWLTCGCLGKAEMECTNDFQCTAWHFAMMRANEHSANGPECAKRKNFLLISEKLFTKSIPPPMTHPKCCWFKNKRLLCCTFDTDTVDYSGPPPAGHAQPKLKPNLFAYPSQFEPLQLKGILSPPTASGTYWTMMPLFL